MAIFIAGMASGYELHTIVTLNTQSVENNQSYIHRELKIVKTNANVSASATTGNSWSWVQNGTTRASGSFTYSFPLGSTTSKLLWASDEWVGHNSDGTLDISVQGNVGTLNIGSASGGGVVSLPTIARASVPTLSQSHTDAGSSVTISTNRASTSFTHTARYALGSASGTIATGVTTSTAWTLPMSLLTQLPAKTVEYGFIYLDTYNGGTLVGTKSVMFAVRAGASVVPVVTGFTATETTPNVATWVGAFVQSVSKPQIATSGAAGVYGSTITGVTFKVGAQTMTSTGAARTVPLPVPTSGSVAVSVTVTDSRGRSATHNGTITVLAYTPPAISGASIQRTSDSAGVTVTDSGTFVRINLTTTVKSLINTTQRNVANYAISYRAVGSTGAWTADKTGTRTIPTDATKIMGTATLLADVSREYQITVTDRFGSATAVLTLGASILIHMDGALGVGIRKRRTQGALDVLGDVYVTGVIYSDGTAAVLNTADLATQTQAEAGTVNTTVMTPLRTRQAITKFIALTVDSGIHSTGGASIAVDATADYTINFTKTFSSAPVVTATCTSSRFTCAISSVTATSVVVQVKNNSTGAGPVGNLHWIAVLN